MLEPPRRLRTPRRPPSWSVRKPKRGEPQNSATTKKQNIKDLCVLGPSWECSWRPLWGRPGGLLGHLEVTSVTLGALLCCLG
eukprot:4953936-Pyramimonas_sp.AAC.1